MNTKKAVVLITGCSSGIGRALSLEFASKDFKVYASARNIRSIQDLKSESISCLELDVSSYDSVRKAVKSVIDSEGKIDCLVNNAGFLLAGPIIETPEESIRKLHETNVIGPINLSREVIPYMLRQKSGRIINIGSISAIMVTPFGGFYSGSKAELHAISDAMRMELKPFGIDVIYTITGGVKSELSRKANIEIPASSIYKSIAEGINKRARVSQSGATDTGKFARIFVRKVSRKNPPAYFKIAKGARLYSLLKLLLPVSILDNMRSKKFLVNTLSDNVNIV